MTAANFLFRHARGPILGYIGDMGVRQLRLPRDDDSDGRVYRLHNAPNIATGRWLHAALEQYFVGVRQDFADIPIAYAGATELQRAVGSALAANALAILAPPSNPRGSGLRKLACAFPGVTNSRQETAAASCRSPKARWSTDPTNQAGFFAAVFFCFLRRVFPKLPM